MHRIKMMTVSSAALLACLAAGDALAQKAKDTLRMPFARQISTVDPYMESGAPNRFMAENVHDGLVAYDETANKVAPLLAKSWKQVDPKTLEFDLREDLVWHDGQKFDADDVAYFLGWLADPKSELRNRESWAWIDKVEKLGPHKVRIVAERPAPFYLTRLAFETYIYPEHIHKPLEDKKAYGQFGRTPIGTGPYKYQQFDRDGIRLMLNKDFKHGGAAKEAGVIGTVFMKHVPDIQTQMAGFLVGEWDLMTDARSDQARAMAARDPAKYKLTAASTMGYVFATMDANGVSENKILMNPLVRKAFFMGVDRAELAELYWGGAKRAFSTDNLCFKFMAGCDFTDGAIKYDPAEAKRLLTQAGYPNGVDVDISTVSNTVVEDVAKAMSGQLRRVGINAKIDAGTFPTMFKREREGKATIRMSVHSPRVPDVSGLISYFYGDTPQNKYFADRESRELAHAANEEMDETKRKAFIRKMLERNAEQAFILPVTPTGVFILHTNEVKLRRSGRLEIHGYYLNDLAWN